jgi:predicted permease
MTTGNQSERVFPEGYQFPEGHLGDELMTAYVSDGYFETLGIPIIAGRGFMETDLADSPRVAVVNELFARRYFGGNPLGKRIRMSPTGPWIEIVGMTPTGKYASVFDGPTEFLYLPYTQVPAMRMTLIAETHGDPAAMTKPLREMLHSIDANVPLYAIRTLEDLFDQRSVKIADILIGVVGTLGTMGLVLALVGLYAVVSYQVSRKTREIGIRMALGAQRSGVMQLVMKDVLWLTGISIAATIPLALLLARGLGTQLYGVRAGDPAALGTAILLVSMVAMIAAVIPARRAAGVNPTQALRSE